MSCQRAVCGVYKCRTSGTLLYLKGEVIPVPHHSAEFRCFLCSTFSIALRGPPSYKILGMSLWNSTVWSVSRSVDACWLNYSNVQGVPLLSERASRFFASAFRFFTEITMVFHRNSTQFYTEKHNLAVYTAEHDEFTSRLLL